jgi:hypothetical protein
MNSSSVEGKELHADPTRRALVDPKRSVDLPESRRSTTAKRTFNTVLI